MTHYMLMLDQTTQHKVNACMKTNVAQRFLKLLEKHFPKTSSRYKIFNRNSAKSATRACQTSRMLYL